MSVGGAPADGNFICFPGELEHWLVLTLNDLSTSGSSGAEGAFTAQPKKEINKEKKKKEIILRKKERKKESKHGERNIVWRKKDRRKKKKEGKQLRKILKEEKSISRK